MKIVYKFSIIFVVIMFNACISDAQIDGGYMGIEYKIKLHDTEEFVFSYVKKIEIDKFLLTGDWNTEKELQFKVLPNVYSKAGEYIAIFQQDRLLKDYGLYCTNRIFFERLKEFKLILFDADNDFTQIHFYESLSKEKIIYLRDNNFMESVIIEGLSTQYNEHFKLDDGRILVILNGHRGQLFMSLDELYMHRKRYNGDLMVPVIPIIR